MGLDRGRIGHSIIYLSRSCLPAECLLVVARFLDYFLHRFAQTSGTKGSLINDGVAIDPGNEAPYSSKFSPKEVILGHGREFEYNQFYEDLLKQYARRLDDDRLCMVCTR